MSRHRNIRNLNIEGDLQCSVNIYTSFTRGQLADELNDDALSDGGDEELTAEQQGLHEITLKELFQTEYLQAQMNDGLEQVRLVVGDEDVSGLSDNVIKDVLWNNYYDIEKTVDWALGS